MTSRKAEPGYIWRSRDIYGGVGIEFNGFGDNLGMKLAEPLKIPSLLYTKNSLKIRLQNVPGGAVEPNLQVQRVVSLVWIMTVLHHDGFLGWCHSFGS